MMSPDSSGEISFTTPEEIARIQEQLRRLLSSRTFRTAQREKTLLRYLVEQTIGGRGRELKEYTVGVEGLGCGESFDPRRDGRSIKRPLDSMHSCAYTVDPMADDGEWDPRKAAANLKKHGVDF